MLIFLTGLIASAVHVLAGPDHLAAVTPFSFELRKKAWMVGLSWGIGHTIGMLAIGTLFILTKEIIPVDAISRNSEVIVGILLICIGLWAMLHQRPWCGKQHIHPHIHTDGPHYMHIHRHDHREIHTHEHKHAGSYPGNTIAALAIGIVHGLAGFSHFLSLLPALAMPSAYQSAVYLIGFGIGTVLAMTLFTTLLGFAASRLQEQQRYNLLVRVNMAGGAFAILVGLIWIGKMLF